MEHHKPFDESISKLIPIFADSPIQNPDGKTGISLHVELRDEILHKDIISWDEESSIRANYLGSAEQRSDTNNENIIKAKQTVYHYLHIVLLMKRAIPKRVHGGVNIQIVRIYF